MKDDVLTKARIATMIPVGLWPAPSIWATYRAVSPTTDASRTAWPARAEMKQYAWSPAGLRDLGSRRSGDMMAQGACFPSPMGI